LEVKNKMDFLTEQEIEIDEIKKYLFDYPNGRYAVKGISLEQCKPYEHRLGGRFHIEKKELDSSRYRMCIMNKFHTEQGCLSNA